MVIYELIEKILRRRSCKIGKHVKIGKNCHVRNSQIGDYTYISPNAWLSQISIGKFCSIGPNLLAGWGIHPLNGITTSPMFYSPNKQNGMTLSPISKFEERKHITIGNDVFIGANVTILDGITIGNGAVIGAGAVVSKDIPAYAIAVGCPITIKKFRFSEECIQQFETLKWWDFPEDRLKIVENSFWDIDAFLQICTSIDSETEFPPNL